MAFSILKNEFLDTFAWCKQVHGQEFKMVSRSGCQGQYDAMVTDTPGLGLVIRTADCVPVLVSNGNQVAAIHAGWRGLRSDIISKTINGMDNQPSRLLLDLQSVRRVTRLEKRLSLNSPVYTSMRTFLSIDHMLNLMWT